ncbi:MAG: menaquinone biosynthesis protein [Pirellulaceae bacterium]|nr:menaquinone biosynthesis protein [Pirellulaceae bacterium]
MTFRIGAVSYLNTKPLIHHLEQTLPGAELSLDLPSRLATQLHQGQLDVALIPSIELFRSPNPDLSIVSDACIACRGPVWSVQLLFRKPPQQVKSLALDEGSRTSAALAQILLKQRCGIRPELRPLPIGSPAESADADAILVIGDRALRGWGSEFIEVWDLGDQWCRATELPFVFAMWVARPHVDLSGLALGLEAARDAGVASAQEIAQQQAARYGLSIEKCLEYFQKFLYFKLDMRQQQGLELFYHRAVEVGLAPAGREHLLLVHSS